MSLPLTSPKLSVLVVDDDPLIREVLTFALTRAGFACIEATNGREALTQAQAHDPALIVLDMLMPEIDGMDVCRIIRSRSSVPVLILTSRDEEVERIVGLEIGADDYVTKPFSPREVVARVRAILRRVSPPTAAGLPIPEGVAAVAPDNPAEISDRAQVRQGRLTLFPHRYEAHWDSTPVALTATEFGLLQTLMSAPGRVFNRDQLMDGAYPLHTVVSERTIDSHIRRLRRKFFEAGSDPIETVHGIGYKLGPCV